MKEHYGENEVTVIPQNADDLYLIYNLLAPEDRLTTKTTRRLKKNEGGGSDNSNRVPVILTTKVISAEFAGFGEIIRVKGTIVVSSDSNVTLGSHHTHKIELFKQVTIKKKEGWTNFQKEQLHSSQFGTAKGIIVVALDDESAIITQLGSHATQILLELRPSIPRKGSDVSQHQQGLTEFFNEVAEFLQNNVKDKGITQIFIGGPGFTHSGFMDRLRSDWQNLAKITSDFATRSSGRNAIKELIEDHISDSISAASEARRQLALVSNILDQIGKNTGLVAYGRHIDKAIEIAAIDHLLILDDQLHQSIELRRKIEKLIENVRQIGGKISIMSSMHQSGDIIRGFGGMVALLRFKLPNNMI